MKRYFQVEKLTVFDYFLITILTYIFFIYHINLFFVGIL